MRKVLLIGGYGFFGSHMYSALSSEYSVEVMSRFKHDNSIVQGKDWIEGDITSKTDVERVLGRGYDYVFDFVGLINEKAQKHSEVNITGTQNLIDAASSSGTDPKIIYISAINAEKGNTEYFRTKREAEKIISAYKNNLIIRPSIIYGKYDFLTLQFYKLINQNVPLFPKSGLIYPVYVDDIVNVVKSKIDTIGVLNICGVENLRFGDMFNIFRKRFGKKPVHQAPMLLFKAMSPILARAGIIEREQIDMLGYDFYRSDNILKKVINKPMQYSEFVQLLEAHV
ncbi:MAG: NAD-dependent epimerase/dehydratase family protein [Methanothrix sp.]